MTQMGADVSVGLVGRASADDIDAVGTVLK
jgi:hypothetical protein